MSDVIFAARLVFGLICGLAMTAAFYSMGNAAKHKNLVDCVHAGFFAVCMAILMTSILNPD